MIQVNEVGKGFVIAVNFGGIKLTSGDSIPVTSVQSKATSYDSPFTSRVAVYDGAIVALAGQFEGDYTELKIELIIENNGKKTKHDLGNVFGKTIVSSYPSETIKFNRGAAYSLKVTGKNKTEDKDAGKVEFSCFVELCLFYYEVNL